MGPKKDDNMSKKTEKKIQEKIIDDKTFGLKNKNKSKVVQKYIIIFNPLDLLRVLNKL